MRVIKFRAWDKKRKMFNLMDLRDAIAGDDAYALCGSQGTDWAVDRENSCTMNCKCELQQFTGLKDKNGKEIYEGDLLKDDCDRILLVKFGKLPLDKSGDCVCTYEAFYCLDDKYDRMYECQNIGDWMEVVGNIYESDVKGGYDGGSE